MRAQVGLVVWFFSSLATIQSQQLVFDDAQTLLKSYCQTCHQGKSPAGRLDITRYATADSVIKEPQAWNRILLRLREGSMPPKGVPAPTSDQREKFSELSKAVKSRPSPSSSSGNGWVSANLGVILNPTRSSFRNTTSPSSSRPSTMSRFCSSSSS